MVKNLPANAEDTEDAGDTESNPGSGKYPGEENGNPLLYSCLDNSMDRGAWLVTVHRGGKERDTTQYTCMQFSYKLVDKPVVFLYIV